MSIPQKPDIPGKACKVCGAPLVRKRYGKTGQTLESYDRYLAREHCSQACANTKAEVVKDTLHWRARKHRKDACEECGATEDLHVHHDDRDHANNDPANLRTLCASCHLKLHWREDREKRLAAAKRPPEICVICDGEFWPRWRGIQTCSPGCKRALLSRSLTEYFARQRETA